MHLDEVKDGDPYPTEQSPCMVRGTDVLFWIDNCCPVISVGGRIDAELSRSINDAMLDIDIDASSARMVERLIREKYVG